MQKGKVWCIPCNIAHENDQVCSFIKAAGFVEHTEFNERQDWTQPCTFFKRIHTLIMSEKHRLSPGKDGQKKPRDIFKRKILESESNKKIF